MIVTLTGPSGCGKTSLLFRLIKLWPDRIQAIVSSTSRPPRPREVDGENYYFVDKSAFYKPDMVEKVEFGGNLYGLTAQEIESARTSSKVCIAIMDAKGSLWMKENYNAVRIYMKISPGSSRYRLFRRDGKEAGLERHRIDISENLFDAKNYDIIIHCNGKSKGELAEQFFCKLEAYFAKENLP